MAHIYNTYKTAMRRLTERSPVVEVKLLPVEVMALVSSIQLALRHPTFPETTEKVCRAFIDEVSKQFSSEPDLVKIIQMGFEPEFDL